MSGLILDRGWEGKIYSGRWREVGQKATVFEKATGEAMASTGIASASDVRDAATAARAAQRQWAKLPGAARGDVLRKVASLLLEHRAELAEQLVRETGSIQPKAQWEVEVSAREFVEAATLASEPAAFITASLDPDRENIARRIPVGTVGVITPWNSPLILGTRAIAPALAMGNAVILKPDVQTPIIGGVVFAAVLERSGLPTNLFHVLPGGAETGEALVRDPDIDMVSFTGSTRVGRQVGSIAGGMLKRVSLELGGNNPYVVLSDVDIEAAASAGAWGSFFHQGQICLTAGRHLVHESIADAYTKALVRKARALVVGNPMQPEVQVGPIINERQAANVDRIVAETVSAGGKIETGGSRRGLFFEPTVITGVHAGMAAFDEEIFGPVAPITTFSTDEEAIALANQTEYGLVAAVVSANVDRARGIADNIRAGVVHVNDQTVLHGIYSPIGGLGISGNGFAHSTITNAQQFTEWQWLSHRSKIAAYPF
jgi:benzaldehyde dehydrogenase (NAD)